MGAKGLGVFGIHFPAGATRFATALTAVARAQTMAPSGLDLNPFSRPDRFSKPSGLKIIHYD
ncbi:hypothetical protein [Flavobacterium soli]|uniref:hypothetical protein n=1 Tax=Flavobacterium soli TaxID=344881 RepID=UPI000405A58D|nr:hypothetical protein [Flavobacterium soli]